MNFGFIGCGNMGSAIIGGIIKNGIANADNIYVSDKSKIALDNINNSYGVYTSQDNTKIVSKVQILFLCVKPQLLYNVIDEIKSVVNSDTVIVSIVAGQSIEMIENAFEKEIKLVRVMPNTPALVGEGMSAMSPNGNVTDDEMKVVSDVFNSFGRGEIVSENLMDAVTAVSGSSPAYVFVMIEAMADAAVKGGMTRDKAYVFAAQAVLGSAKMLLETGKHPGELKDMVCSPAGTTIDAVAELEACGFRKSIINAMTKCMERSSELGKQK